jgi:hypothetical protein
MIETTFNNLVFVTSMVWLLVGLVIAVLLTEADKLDTMALKAYEEKLYGKSKI